MNNLQLPKYFCAVLLLVATWTSTLHAAEGVYYQWHDETGKLNVSDQRPAVGVQYTTVKKRTRAPSAGSSSTDGLYNAVKQNEEAKQRAAADADGQSADAANDNARQGNCKNASEELRVINENARVREVDAEGNYHYLSDEEKAQRGVRAQENIDKYCGS